MGGRLCIGDTVSAAGSSWWLGRHMASGSLVVAVMLVVTGGIRDASVGSRTSPVVCG